MSPVPSAPEPQIDSDAVSTTASRLAQAIVFSTLVLCGVGIFAVVALAHLDWFTPTLVYGFVLYVAWLRFFQPDRKA